MLEESLLVKALAQPFTTNVLQVKLSLYERGLCCFIKETTIM